MKTVISFHRCSYFKLYSKNITMGSHPRKYPDKLDLKWFTTLICLGAQLASPPKHFSFPQYGTGICFQTLNRITERKREKYYTSSPGFIPGASTLTDMCEYYAEEGMFLQMSIVP